MVWTVKKNPESWTNPRPWSILNSPPQKRHESIFFNPPHPKKIKFNSINPKCIQTKLNNKTNPMWCDTAPDNLNCQLYCSCYPTMKSQLSVFTVSQLSRCTNIFTIYCQNVRNCRNFTFHRSGNQETEIRWQYLQYLQDQLYTSYLKTGLNKN